MANPYSYIHGGQRDRELVIQIEDVEGKDFDNLTKVIDQYFQSEYPEFEPEIVYGAEKEYFLPALKVLKLENGYFFSPGYESEWVDGELKAECRSRATLRHGDNGTWIPETPSHEAPYDGCDCGIYGSVNLEEVEDYINKTYYSSLYYSNLIYSTSGQLWRGVEDSLDPHVVKVPKNVLCLIEPAPDAKVILCRKGWRASHAFISEIVGETISKAEASRLLSIAWKRNIDITGLKLYENR